MELRPEAFGSQTKERSVISSLPRSPHRCFETRHHGGIEIREVTMLGTVEVEENRGHDCETEGDTQPTRSRSHE